MLERRLHFLADMSALLMAPADLEEALAAVARLAAGTIADCAVIDVDDGDGPPRRVTAVSSERARAALMALLADRDASGPSRSDVARRVRRSGRPALLASTGTSRPRTASGTTRRPGRLGRLGLTSMLVAPLPGRQGVLGSLTLATVGRRTLMGADVALGVEVGRLLGGALEASRRSPGEDGPVAGSRGNGAASSGGSTRSAPALPAGRARGPLPAGRAVPRSGAGAGSAAERSGGPQPGALMPDPATSSGTGDQDRTSAGEQARDASAASRSQRLHDAVQGSRGLARGVAALGRLIADSLEPDDVAQWMTDSVCLLLRAKAACLFRWEPESRRAVGVALTGDLEVPHSGELVFPETDGLGGLALRERRVVWTPNVLVDPRIEYSRPVRTWMARSSLRSALAAPLSVGETVIGTLVVWGDSGREFAPDEAHLLQTFADHATIVLGSARGGERGGHGPQDVDLPAWRGALQEIVEGARQAATADLAFLVTTEGDSGRTLSVVFAGVEDQARRMTVSRRLATGPWRRLWRLGSQLGLGTARGGVGGPVPELLWIADCRTEPGLGEDPIGQVLLECHTRTSVVVPLRYLGRVVGFLGVGFEARKEAHPSVSATLGRLAEEIAVPLAGHRARTRLRALAASQERTRIGHELHDMLSQVLFSIALKLDWSLRRLPRGSAARPKLLEIRRETGLVMRTIREMIAGRVNGSGEAISADALPVRLRALVATFRELTGIPVDLTVSDDREPPDEVAAEVLYKVFQEGLANVAKHARARRVLVRLEIGAGRAEFEITDDGVGLAPELASRGAASPGRFGLRQLAVRIGQSGGELGVMANEPSGLRLRGVLPWHPGRVALGPVPSGPSRP